MGMLKVRTGVGPDVWTEIGSSGADTDTAALALKVAKAGDVMTGALIMQNVTPEFRIIETDQAPDSKAWRIYASGGLLKLGSALDNLTAVQELTFTRDGTVTATRFLGDGGYLTGLNASNISSGTLNNLRLNTVIDSNTTGYAAKLQQARTISLTGDVVGTTTFDGSADASIATTITSLAITLGDDTEGNFVSSITGTANRVLVTGSGAEKAAVTLNLPQDIHAGASPTFLSATFSQTTGTPPFTINSGTKVTSLNADRLDDQEGAYYLNLANTTGNLPSARLVGSYTGITEVGTLTTLTTGATAPVLFGLTPKVDNPVGADWVVWHEGNDGPGSTLNADLLDGLDATAFASAASVEALLGDLLFVGLWDAAKYAGAAMDLNFTGIANQNVLIPYTLKANSDADVRLTCIRPTIASGSQRVVSGGNANTSFRIEFTTTGITMSMRNSGGTWRSVSFAYIDPVEDGVLRMPRAPREITHNPGTSEERKEWVSAYIQLRVAWDAATDTLTGYWRDTGYDLRSDVGWFESASATFLGDQLPTGARNLAFSDEASFYYNANTTPPIAGQIQRALVKANAYHLNPASGLVSTPDQTRMHVDADMTWLFRVDINNFTNMAERPFASQRDTSNNIGWSAGMRNGSQFVLAVSTNGTTETSAVGADLSDYIATDVGGAVVPEVRTLAATLDLDDGAGHHVISYYIMDEGSLIFIPIDSVQINGAIATSLFNSTALVRIAARTGLTNYDGRIYFAEMRTGLDPLAGTTRWRFDAADWSGSGLTHSDGRGDIWTQTGAGTLTTGQDFVLDFNVRKIPGTNVSSFNIAQQSYPAQMVTIPSAVNLTTAMPVPSWAAGPNNYRNGIYWICSSGQTEVDFIDTDYSGRYGDTDEPVDVANGDWIIGLDPLADPETPGGPLIPLNKMTFQYIPFSTETYVKAKLGDHIGDTGHPHAAAGYLRAIDADLLYSPLGHEHDIDIRTLIQEHIDSADDPHAAAGYITQIEAEDQFALEDHNHFGVYEPWGTVHEHELLADPHTQYLSEDEAAVQYSRGDHKHDSDYSPLTHTHTFTGIHDLIPTDASTSARLFIGATSPTVANTPASGDLWLDCFDITNTPPIAAPTFIVASTAPSSVGLSWTYPTGLVTRVTLEYSLTGAGGWATLLDDTTAPLDTTYLHSGLAERTDYWYRLALINSVGASPFASLGPTTTGNTAPVAPVVTAGAPTSNACTITWAVPAGVTVNDALAPTGTYEVYLNSTTLKATLNVGDTRSYTFTGLAENTAYTFGVRAKDSAGLWSPQGTDSATTTNAAPPAPASTSETHDHDSITFSWAAVSVPDFDYYRVWRDGVGGVAVTGTSYTFSGLAYSTAYNLHVDTWDDGGLGSTTANRTVTTSPNPDTTPPTPCVISSWKPETNYGRMVIRFTCGTGGVAAYQYAYSVNGGAWAYSGEVGATNSQSVALALGTWGAGTTIQAAARNRDANNNWSAWDYTGGYGLLASPTYITATATNQWRPYGSGQWRGLSNMNPYMDYFDEIAKNIMGVFIYGTKCSDTLGGRPITALSIYMHRIAAGWADTSTPYFYTHTLTTNPAPTTLVSPASQPALANGPVTGAGILVDEGLTMTLNTTMGNALSTGAARGIAIWDSTPVGQSNYCKFASTSDNSNTGRLMFSHLG